MYVCIYIYIYMYYDCPLPPGEDQPPRPQEGDVDLRRGGRLPLVIVVAVVVVVVERRGGRLPHGGPRGAGPGGATAGVGGVRPIRVESRTFSPTNSHSLVTKQAVTRKLLARKEW